MKYLLFNFENGSETSCGVLVRIWKITVANCPQNSDRKKKRQRDKNTNEKLKKRQIDRLTNRNRKSYELGDENKKCVGQKPKTKTEILRV